MNQKEEAIRAMKFAGWIVDNPDAIVVDEHRDDLTVLKQDGVGTWFVSDAGVTFHDDELFPGVGEFAECPNPDSGHGTQEIVEAWDD